MGNYLDIWEEMFFLLVFMDLVDSLCLDWWNVVVFFEFWLLNDWLLIDFLC